MEYHEAADVLFGLRRFRPDPGTATTATLLDHLDNPQTAYDCVQIAGSNGKGSTARMVASILQSAGYRVGLYTSPHLEDVRERIQVDGQRISKHRITEYVESMQAYVVEQAAIGESPTFFEALTGLAFWQFAAEDVDIAVLEVGIGGRYDATSVVDPVASAVTTVTLEHTDVLGDTVSEIARDKATVATEETPLVTAATGEALTAIQEVAPTVHRVGTNSDTDTTVTYHGRPNQVESAITIAGNSWTVETRLGLLGPFQAVNAGVAAVLTRQLRSVNTSTVATGLRAATWPGRVEVMETDPLVVLDGAHNPGACSALTSAIEEFDYESLVLVVGAMHDKDLAGMATALPDCEQVIVCRASVDRAADPAVLQAVFDEHIADVTIEPAVETAVETAYQHVGNDDCVLVCGSLAVVAEARRRWTRVAIPRHLRGPSSSTTALSAADIPREDRDHVDQEFERPVLHLIAHSPRVYRLATLAERHDVTAAISGVAGVDREPVPVLLSGTKTAFQELIQDLELRSDGVAPYAGAIRAGLQRSTIEYSSPWGPRPTVMGVVNVTPDSFHDGGRYNTVDAAVQHATDLVTAGADIVDIGGESTRPGADPISPTEERDRVLPVIEQLTDIDADISIDTRRASVARQALEAGADIVNDVSGLSDPEMRFVVDAHDATIIVMHSIDTPVDPTYTPQYDDVVTDVISDLIEPIRRLEQIGVASSQIIVDPGLGFGKTAEESFTLLNRLPELTALGYPIAVGHSHKSMFQEAGYDPDERLFPTVAGTTLAAERGADIIRVHDIPENTAAIDTVTNTITDR